MEEFSVKQTISYNLQESGEAKVTYTIDLANQTALLYAKEYSLRIEGSPIYDVQAFDNSGDILKEATPNSILAEFKNPTLGKNQVKNFTISYKQKELATRKGSLYELVLPSIKNPYSTQTKIDISTPDSWGQIAQQSIPLANNSFSTDQQYIEKSIFSFGDAQIVEYQLNYSLENESATESLKIIPIPPDTALQKVRIINLSPRPDNISEDQDGNWFASYKLKAFQNLDIILNGQAKIANNTSYKHNLDPIYLQKLTQPEKNWPKLETKIDTAKQAYDKVVGTLEYSQQRASAPSPQTIDELLLNPKNAICTDFSNYFISLARSNSIPSRLAIGFALSNNQSIKPVNQDADILHAWPQYLKDNIWVDIDPTWGKTTAGVDYFNSIDLNHLAFVIQGQSSELPLPPGSFRSKNSPKSVNVTFSKQPFLEQKQKLQITTKYKGLFTQELQTYNPNPNSYESYPPFSYSYQSLPLLSLQNHRLISVLLLTLFGVIIILVKMYEKIHKTGNI